MAKGLVARVWVTPRDSRIHYEVSVNGETQISGNGNKGFKKKIMESIERYIDGAI